MRYAILIFGAVLCASGCSDVTNRTSTMIETNESGQSQMTYENNEYRQVVNGSAQSECAIGEDDVRECRITGTGTVTIYLRGRLAGEYTLPDEGALTCISTHEDVTCR